RVLPWGRAARLAEIARLEREMTDARAAAAAALVADARVVVTDRLHGGVLALPLGREVVLLPDRPGKVARHPAARATPCAHGRTAPALATARAVAAEILSAQRARADRAAAR